MLWEIETGIRLCCNLVMYVVILFVQNVYLQGCNQGVYTCLYHMLV